MPIEAVGEFQQLAAKRDPTPWLRQEAVSTPKLGKLNQRWYFSNQHTTPILVGRPTGSVSEPLDSFALVGRRVFTDWELPSQTNLPRMLLAIHPQRAWPTVANDEERVRENLTYLVVRDLIEREQIGAARKLLAGLPLEYLSDPLVRRLLKTLAQPVVKVRQKQDVDRQKDYDWLRDHAREYAGQWVALHEGQLLAASATLRDISEKVKALRLSHPPLLHLIK